MILLSLLISNSKRELESILFAEYNLDVKRYCVMHTVVMQEWLMLRYKQVTLIVRSLATEFRLQ